MFVKFMVRNKYLFTHNNERIQRTSKKQKIQKNIIKFNVVRHFVYFLQKISIFIHLLSQITLKVC